MLKKSLEFPFTAKLHVCVFYLTIYFYANAWFNSWQFNQQNFKVVYALN